MPRRLKIFGIVLAIVAAVVIALLPARTQQTGAPAASVVRGAFHIHSNRSDGSGPVDEIAAAAARAGLQFIILTDHGDGTRPLDAPVYRSGVLTIDGVELNTTGGHFAAFGLPVSPYPIAGTPADVIEDVHRLGGFGVAAHPGSPRSALSWQDWESRIDGVEWLNADSEWRDEPRIPIARALTTYWFRGPQSMATLLDRPVSVLQKWDALAATRKVVGLAGSDAHARLGVREDGDPDTVALHVQLPSYEALFRTFSNHVALDAVLSGDAVADAGRVIGAIRAGRVYSVIDALATPGALAFSATSGGHTAQIGDSLPIAGDVHLKAAASAPPGTTLVLLRNGQKIHEVTDGPLEMNGGTDRAAYRIEAYTPNAPGGPSIPWIVSNPIYAGLTPQPAAASLVPNPVSRIPARTGEAAAEKGERDVSLVETRLLADPRARTFAGDPAVHWRYALAPGTPAGQFAAVAVPVSPGLAGFDRVRFRVAASGPSRVWVQLRAPVGNTERWGRTFYADTESRIVDVPFASFAPIGVTSSAQAPLDRVSHLLFVADTLNTLPGKGGEVTISEVGFVK
ncbi:MAG TPA: CehA/McbA family metallohydrolase [Vicinamibacterales bacterium]